MNVSANGSVRVLAYAGYTTYIHPLSAFRPLETFRAATPARMAETRWQCSAEEGDTCD